MLIPKYSRALVHPCAFCNHVITSAGVIGGRDASTFSWYSLEYSEKGRFVPSEKIKMHEESRLLDTLLFLQKLFYNRIYAPLYLDLPQSI